MTISRYFILGITSNILGACTRHPPIAPSSPTLSQNGIATTTTAEVPIISGLGSASDKDSGLAFRLSAPGVSEGAATCILLPVGSAGPCTLVWTLSVRPKTP